MFQLKMARTGSDEKAATSTIRKGNLAMMTMIMMIRRPGLKYGQIHVDIYT